MLDYAREEERSKDSARKILDEAARKHADSQVSMNEMEKTLLNFTQVRTIAQLMEKLHQRKIMSELGVKIANAVQELLDDKKKGNFVQQCISNKYDMNLATVMKTVK